MQCPKCQFDSEAQTTECLKCGIVFTKYLRDQKLMESLSLPHFEEGEPAVSPSEAKRELLNRICALPIALIAGRIIVSATPFVRLLTMWVHEGGHAMTAWLSGFSAMPTAWYTSVSDVRSYPFALVIAALLGYGGYEAWRRRLWLLVFGAGAALLAQTYLTLHLYSDQAQALIIFGGDAGCFLLGSVLMMTFYARRESQLYQNSLRWGLLAIGAASFMDAYATWTGGLQTIPFGENENGPSDPTVLTELYNWPVQTLMHRYAGLATFCLAILVIFYGVGIALSIRELHQSKRSLAA